MSIAIYIKDDLAVQLKSGRKLAVQLTLESLAGHYNVSLTILSQVEGILERKGKK
jgi:hypothetical protein